MIVPTFPLVKGIPQVYPNEELATGRARPFVMSSVPYLYDFEHVIYLSSVGGLTLYQLASFPLSSVFYFYNQTDVVYIQTTRGNMCTDEHNPVDSQRFNNINNNQIKENVSLLFVFEFLHSPAAGRGVTSVKRIQSRSNESSSRRIKIVDGKLRKKYGFVMNG